MRHRQKVNVWQPWSHLKSSLWYRLHDRKQDKEVLKRLYASKNCKVNFKISEKGVKSLKSIKITICYVF